jgi:GPH family glycoside/pentoside/hexuronide:cation symporter
VTGEPGPFTLLRYALPALPLAVLSLPYYVMLPSFYAQSIGIPIAVVGQVLLAIRILDAASDPVAGVLSDRWRPGFGRRRLWVALAAPAVAMAAACVFLPPNGAGAAYLGLWGALLSVAWTAFQVPYAAWGAELSRSYEGRTRVVAWREAFAVAGTLLALVVPALLSSGGNDRIAMTVFAIIVGAGLPLLTWIAVAGVPEPPDLSRRQIGLADSLRNVWRNRPFRRLLAAFFINGLANGLPATLFLFYVEYGLGRAGAAGPLLVLYFLCGIAGIPGWLWLSRRTSKHRAWAIGMLLAIGAFAVVPALGPDDLAAFVAVTIVTGLALGADVVLPIALQADVIDVDTAASGEERAGTYLSLWALATKLALAGAVGLAFPILGAAGFDPARGIVTPAGLTALALLYAGAPTLLKVAAVALVWHFPLDRGDVAALQRTIDSAPRGAA